MDKLIALLESFQLTKTEASVYITLLQEGSLNGYQIAKHMNLSRSSVYAALDKLMDKGAIVAVPGELTEAKVYAAEDINVFLEFWKGRYKRAADELQLEVAKIEKPSVQPGFRNIEGLEKIMAKASTLLQNAKSEVLINTDFDVAALKPLLRTLVGRGVSIIVFSFVDLGLEDLPVTYYRRQGGPSATHWSRLMMVADGHYSLVANSEDGKHFSGTFTENPLMARIVGEHIHHDIYLMRLHEAFGKAHVDDVIRIGTVFEACERGDHEHTNQTQNP